MRQPHEEHLATYAVRSADANVRDHDEPDNALRSPFELDRHRIIESTAFRRLEHKTQVFTPTHHDHFRTRLTHTLEVAQIARCLAAALRVNEALAEAITLAHDLGHPPFGHAGEVALNGAMVDRGGFNHNAHSLRVVDYLEHPIPAFRGLNLTAETRAGLATHATRYDQPDSTAAAAYGSPPMTGPSVEARIASVADRIAYNCHDLEDAIGAEFVTQDELRQVELWDRARQRAVSAQATQPCDEPNLFSIRRVVLDALLDALLCDVSRHSSGLLVAVTSPAEAKLTQRPLVTFSDGVEAQLVELEQFLAKCVYRHADVAAMDAWGGKLVRALFDVYRNRPNELPPRFAARTDEQGIDRVICDYIAGMTDRYCEAQVDRLTPSRGL